MLEDRQTALERENAELRRRLDEAPQLRYDRRSCLPTRLEQRILRRHPATRGISEERRR